MTKVPSARADFSKSTCPAWNVSNAPWTYTTTSSSLGFFPPSLNCSTRLDVVQKCSFFAGSATSSTTADFLLFLNGDLLPGVFARSFSAAFDALSILPTMSVVETPSVLLIVLNLPSRFGAAYASEPSGSRHGSSPCTMARLRSSRPPTCTTPRRRGARRRSGRAGLCIVESPRPGRARRRGRPRTLSPASARSRDRSA
eukprot:31176-Pelagococcus_subviridis.AAC.20